MRNPALPDADTFLAEAAARLKSNSLALRGYVHSVRETKRERNPKGLVTKTTVRLFEVYPSPDPRLTYRRLVSVDGKPAPDLAEKDRSFRNSVRAWITAQEKKNLTEAEAARQKSLIEERKERAIIDELREIFDFRMLGREAVDGRQAIVFAVDPRPRFSPRTREAGIMKHFAGKVWFDEQDYELVRAQMESIDSVNYGWGIVARLGKGATARVERRKLDGGAWLPTYAHFQATGRIMVFKRMQFDDAYEYFDYRKVEAEGITTFSPADRATRER